MNGRWIVLLTLLTGCSQATCPTNAPPVKPAAPQSSLWPDKAIPLPMPRPAPQAVPESRKAPVAKVPKRAPKRAARRCLELMQAEVKQRRTILTNAQRQACFNSKKR